MSITSAPDATSAAAPASIDTRRRAGPILVLLIAAVGVGVLLGRWTDTSPPLPPDLAPAQVTEMIQQQVDAVNSADPVRIAAFYAENGTVTDIGNRFGGTVRGRDEIARVSAANVRLLGPFLDEPGTAVQRGRFVAYAGSWGDVTGGVMVYELDTDGKIVNQWAIHSAQ